jgi:hypothetical protein
MRRFLAALSIALVVLPATAGAAGDVAAPGGDNYINPVGLSDFDHPLPLPADMDFSADTTKYTLQADMFKPPSSGGPPEPHKCGSSAYSKTIWSAFYADRAGSMRITASGVFDPVVGLVPFGNPNTDIAPRLDEGVCIDQSRGHDEVLTLSLQAKRWYAVQVGGTGKPAGGPVKVQFHFTPAAEQTETLRMRLDLVRASAAPGGARFAKLALVQKQQNGKPVGPSPRGATASVHCVRGCKSRTFTFLGSALRIRYLEHRVLVPGTKFALRVTRQSPPARGPQWTVSVDRRRKIHVSPPKYVSG